MRSIRCGEIRHLKGPGPLPDLGNVPQLFRRVHLLAKANCRVPRVLCRLDPIRHPKLAASRPDPPARRRLPDVIAAHGRIRRRHHHHRCEFTRLLATDTTFTGKRRARQRQAQHSGNHHSRHLSLPREKPDRFHPPTARRDYNDWVPNTETEVSLGKYRMWSLSDQLRQVHPVSVSFRVYPWL